MEGAFRGRDIQTIIQPYPYVLVCIDPYILVVST